MRKAGAFVASVAAASTMALQPRAASSSTSSDTPSCSHHEVLPESAAAATSSGKEALGPGSRSAGRAPEADRFAPRFDGLRFIETLVTAHR